MPNQKLTVPNPFHVYRSFRPFSEGEAWALFKIAAIAEAVGWSLLIGGILLRDHVVHSGVPVTVAGRIHGMVFLAYIIAVLAVAPSLRWSLPRTILAGLFSVPPYGSLLYERWSAWHRRRRQLRQLIISAGMS